MTFLGRAKMPTPPTPPPVDDTAAAKLEMHMLAAVARGDAALAAWTNTRHKMDPLPAAVWHLIDGLLDVRNRLTKGLPS